jgi:hypothetical protein
LGQEDQKGIDVADVIANKQHGTLSRDNVGSINPHPVKKMDGNPRRQANKPIGPPDHEANANRC